MVRALKKLVGFAGGVLLVNACLAGGAYLLSPPEAQADVVRYIKAAGDYVYGPIRANGNSSTRIICTPESGSPTCLHARLNSGIFSGNELVMAGSGDAASYPLQSWWASGGTTSRTRIIGRLDMYGPGAYGGTTNSFIQFGGNVTGSLPVCNGGAEGAIVYDTTLHKFKACDGTIYQAFW